MVEAVGVGAGIVAALLALEALEAAVRVQLAVVATLLLALQIVVAVAAAHEIQMAVLAVRVLSSSATQVLSAVQAAR
jgi:hypothetical protein